MTRREVAAAGALLALSLLASLAGAEWLAARVVAAHARVPGPSTPGSHHWINREFVQEQTNGPEGWRVSDFRPGPETRNVLLLGDSFVEGMGLSDEETIAWRLNQASVERRVQFWNGGKSGADLRRAFESGRAARESLPYRFDEAVVFVYIGNDLLDYDALPARDASPEPEPRRLLPGLRGLVERLREGRKRSQWFRVEGVEPYAEWFDENLGYFGRSDPLTASERALMQERFERIPSDLRLSMAEGRVNPWIFQWMLTPGLDDLVYNLDSERDRRALASTLEQIDAFARDFPGPVDVVLVPAKFQVSEEERELARLVLGDAAPEDEFTDLFAANRALAAGLRRGGRVRRVIDLADDVRERGWRAYYYEIDGHFHPAGAARVAERIAPGPMADRADARR